MRININQGCGTSRKPTKSVLQPVVFGIGGAVAQLGERYVRNAEVGGSIPLGSAIFL